MKKNIGKALLTAGLISLASLFPARAIAQNQTLEEKVGLDISINAELAIESENDYFSDFSDDNYIWRYPDTAIKIRNGTINSYDELVNNISPMDTNQKLSLLSGISDSLYSYDYNSDSLPNPVLSQEDFFKNFQNSLNGIYGDVGVCRQISVNIEKLANDIGLRAAAVNGISDNGQGHAYDIIKTEEGLAIIDVGQLLITNTKNVEDVLGLYQNMKGFDVFQHLFFEDGKFKYQLIPEIGRNYIDFAGYDETLGTLKHSLFEHGNSHDKKIALDIVTKNNLTSGEINMLGLFLKYGQIKSASNPEFNLSIAQIGFKREFIIPGIIQINPNLSFLSGNLENGVSDSVLGYNWSLFASTDFEKLNFSMGAKLNNLNRDSNPSIFVDSSFETGASYKMNFGNLNITPYALAKFFWLPNFDHIEAFAPALNEISGGAKINFSKDDLGLSFNPHYSRKIWEQEIGEDVKFNYKNFGIKVGGYLTQSNYDFAPDKRGLEIETSVSSDNFGGKVSYKNDLTDYDGETKTNSAFSISAQVKL